MTDLIRVSAIGGTIGALVAGSFAAPQFMSAVADEALEPVERVASSIDELFGPGTKPGANSRSFVLCPGKAYDRSPCGTGTSAKLACLAADGKLAPGAEWVQESIVGSLFKAKYRRQGDKIVPTITGTAHVTGDTTLLLDPTDPFAWGIG